MLHLYPLYFLCFLYTLLPYILLNLFLFPLASTLLALFSSCHHPLPFSYNLQSVHNTESFRCAFSNHCHSQLPLKHPS